MRIIDADTLIRMVKDHREHVKTRGAIGKGYDLAHEHLIECIEMLAKKTENAMAELERSFFGPD